MRYRGLKEDFGFFNTIPAGVPVDEPMKHHTREDPVKKFMAERVIARRRVDPRCLGLA